MVKPETGKIHTSFNRSWRRQAASSSEPNLQNIPYEPKKAREVGLHSVAAGWQLLRRLFAIERCCRICADICAAFAQGGDIHTSVAAEVFGILPEAVDPEMRRVAKAVNFGVIYGQSPFGLAAALGISQADAAKFIDNYFIRYAGVDRYLESLLNECARSGYATTILGRRRAIQGIRPQPQPGRQRNLPERTAINTVIQGSAADLIKKAMLNVLSRLRREQHPGKLLLQIHDELVLESPTERIAELGHIVREEMEAALLLSVPLRVDLAVGDDWLNTQSIAE